MFYPCIHQHLTLCIIQPSQVLLQTYATYFHAQAKDWMQVQNPEQLARSRGLGLHMNASLAKYVGSPLEQISISSPHTHLFVSFIGAIDTSLGIWIIAYLFAIRSTVQNMGKASNFGFTNIPCCVSVVLILFLLCR